MIVCLFIIYSFIGCGLNLEFERFTEKLVKRMAGWSGWDVGLSLSHACNCDGSVSTWVPSPLRDNRGDYLACTVITRPSHTH